MSLKSLYESGIEYNDFLNSKDVDTKDKVLDIYNNIEIGKDLEDKIKAVDKEVDIIAFAEIWCPDCMLNVPALEKIHILNPKINFKVVSREGNEKYLDDYAIDGKPRIPTFIITDKTQKVLGAFIERPEIVRKVENSGNQVDVIVTKKKYRKGEFIPHTITDVLNIISNKDI
ncbi:thioredoxin family protein [Haloimpatiens massiliensis]|uniref:thioredoxin family protein n=1 Tax=Haloimpatiens massiliensis TaxID=1658110 RepID=UPI000C85F0D0|nr:thioredoxin family protein [Haloimpatiens massiliensis]